MKHYLISCTWLRFLGSCLNGNLTNTKRYFKHLDSMAQVKAVAKNLPKPTVEVESKGKVSLTVVRLLSAP